MKGPLCKQGAFFYFQGFGGTVSNLFQQLEDRDFFKEYVTKFFSNIPSEMAEIFECSVDVDESRVDYAYKAYKLNIQKFAELLYSEDPDHYKRSGAILQALHEASIIQDVSFVCSLDDIETGFSPIHMRYGDTVKEMPFARFFDAYANELNSFIFAYNCCAAYEDDPKPYDVEYLTTMCAFLKGETSHSVESLFMIFKSFMH